jgi:uncharacterized protein (TIGR02118 family)
MVKLVFCCRRRPELSIEQFQKRWLEVHGPLVRRLRARIPQMKRYVQSHTIPGEASEMLRASRGAKPAYDGITEIWFDSLEALGASGEDGVAAARQLYEDELEFIDLASSAVFLTEEHEIF